MDLVLEFDSIAFLSENYVLNLFLKPDIKTEIGFCSDITGLSIEAFNLFFSPAIKTETGFYSEFTSITGSETYLSSLFGFSEIFLYTSWPGSTVGSDPSTVIFITLGNKFIFYFIFCIKF